MKIEGKMQSGTYLNQHDQFLFISMIATNSCPFYFHVLGDHKGSFQTESKDMDNGYAIWEDWVLYNANGNVKLKNHQY